MTNPAEGTLEPVAPADYFAALRRARLANPSARPSRFVVPIARDYTGIPFHKRGGPTAWTYLWDSRGFIRVAGIAPTAENGAVTR